jgi:hypothetical protein
MTVEQKWKQTNTKPGADALPAGTGLLAAVSEALYDLNRHRDAKD